MFYGQNLSSSLEFDSLGQNFSVLSCLNDVSLRFIVFTAASNFTYFYGFCIAFGFGIRKKAQSAPPGYLGENDGVGEQESLKPDYYVQLLHEVLILNSF